MESASSLSAALAKAATRYPGFTSFKTSTPIHYRKRWFRDGLIDATLDESVEAISPAITPPEDLPGPFEFAFRQRSAQGLAIVLLSQSPHTPQISVPNHSVIVLQRQHFKRSLRSIASREIWARKRYPVDAADRYRAIEYLLQCNGATVFSTLVPVLRNQSLDPVHQIFSYLATGFLTTSLEAGIGPKSVLRIGPMGFTG